MYEYADVFAEGGVHVNDEEFKVYSAKVECKAYNAETGIVKLEVHFEGEFEESGHPGPIEGWLACEVTNEA